MQLYFTDRLRRTRAFAKWVIILERLWPLALPALIVVAIFLATAWFGVFRIIPDWARIAAVTAFALVMAVSLYPLRLFRSPASTEVDRHIERINLLRHTPVTAQSDRLTTEGEPFADALWKEHQLRISRDLDRLSGGFPKTGVPDRDPWALRAVAALLLVVSFAWSLGVHGGRITDPFREHVTQLDIPPRIDAWVTPPAYTSKPPIFLTASTNVDHTVFDVPAGSIATLRAAGGKNAFTLSLINDQGFELSVPPDGSNEPDLKQAQQFSAELSANAELVLKDQSSVLRSWTFRVIPDKAPVIKFAREPKRTIGGTLELAYLIEDDYGAASAQAVIERDSELSEGARPLYEAPEFTLNLPRSGARITEAKTGRDLSEHPWAGTAVRISLHATDAAGQEGTSEVKHFVLPSRTFTNPLALALIEQRQLLALDANQKRHVLQLMDALTLWPEETFSVMAHYLAIMTARTRLMMASSDDSLREVVDYLWEIALGIEDGDLTAAEKRLRQAQEALRQALENGASDQEIEELMAELREAMNEFLRELAERALQDQNFANQLPSADMELSQRDLQRMLDQIEEMAKSGMRDQAQELLSQLQDMMNNLQAMRQPGGEQGGQQGEMRQQMDRLGEIMRRQQELMNETFRMDQMQRGQRGENGMEGGSEGEEGQGGMTPQELAEMLRRLQEGQGELQGELGELMDGLRGLGINPGEDFGEAGQFMGKAGRALGEADGEGAVDNQGEALEALRRGAQDMLDQMQQAMQGEGGGSEVGGRRNADRDPLGRPRATTGPDFGDSVEVPDEIDVQRAREILEAIRKRLGNVLSPELEKQYLERLLELR